MQSMTGALSDDDGWLLRLLLNLTGYASIALPCVVVGRVYLRYQHTISSALSRAGCGLADLLLYRCVLGGRDTPHHNATAAAYTALPSDGSDAPVPTPSRAASSLSTAVRLCLCVLGLMVSYLLWGVVQEKVMTTKYSDRSGSTARFTDSQFLVFINRVFAFTLSALYLAVCGRNDAARTTTPHQSVSPPLYQFSYSSFSNIMSSWCQYEALKFVSFPTQVLAKASKVIPVMLMGKLVSGNKYECYEYLVAVLISLGMSLFLFGAAGSSKSDSSGGVTTVSGILLLLGYMMFDSFTSNWQAALYGRHPAVSNAHMMCAVNMFSCLLTSVSLSQQGGFARGISFMLQYPAFMYDCLLLSVFSAVGQMFIFYTIMQFGAVIFTIIMTIRQGLAVMISCLLYGHSLSASGALGVLIVFSAVFLRIYCSHRLRRIRRSRQPPPPQLLADKSSSAPSGNQLV